MSAIIDLSFEERVEVAKEHGVTDFRRIQFELDQLRRNGLLVDLTIGGVSLFSRSASWIEFGVIDQATQEFFKKGRKSFAPDVEAALVSCEHSMRYTLKSLSYEVSGFHPWRWISWKAYDEFVEKFAEYQERWQTTVNEFLDHYDEYLEKNRGDFKIVAHNAWMRIQALAKDAGEEAGAARIDGIIYADEESFVEAIVRQHISRVPTYGQFAEYLKFEYVTGMIYGYEDALSEKVKKAKIDAAAQEAYLDAHEKERQVQHAESLRRIELAAKEAELDEKAIKIAAMREAEAEHARALLTQYGSPFETVFLQLRERMAKSAENMLKSIRKNDGRVRGQIARQGRGLLDFYRLMAAHDDEELLGLLNELVKEIGNDSDSAKTRRPERIVETLIEITRLAEIDAARLSEATRASFIEL